MYENKPTQSIATKLATAPEMPEPSPPETSIVPSRPRHNTMVNGSNIDDQLRALDLNTLNAQLVENSNGLPNGIQSENIPGRIDFAQLPANGSPSLASGIRAGIAGRTRRQQSRDLMSVPDMQSLLVQALPELSAEPGGLSTAPRPQGYTPKTIKPIIGQDNAESPAAVPVTLTPTTAGRSQQARRSITLSFPITAPEYLGTEKYVDCILYAGSSKTPFGIHRVTLHMKSAAFRTLEPAPTHGNQTPGFHIRQIEPDIMQVLLNWVYGKPFDLTQKLAYDPTDNQTFLDNDFVARLFEGITLMGMSKMTDDIVNGIIDPNSPSTPGHIPHEIEMFGFNIINEAYHAGYRMTSGQLEDYVGPAQWEGESHRRKGLYKLFSGGFQMENIHPELVRGLFTELLDDGEMEN